ncbi:hypothetical protein LCGC14_2583070, partial [marine sediment metagenome]
MATLTASEARTVYDAITEPEVFWRDVLGVEHLFPKQMAIPASVRDHRRTSVLGANGSGKDHTAGRLLLWWLAMYEKAKVIVIGPTFRQVSDIVFREARVAYQQSKFPLGGL